MDIPFYIDQRQAREVLEDIGIQLNDRQIKRAAEPDAHGQRKLPFFRDPVDGRLKIEKGKLLGIYNKCQLEADSKCKYNDGVKAT